MRTYKHPAIKFGLTFTLILSILAGCASTPSRIFKAPAPAVTRASKVLFEDAYQAQEKGQYRKAIALWKDISAKGDPNRSRLTTILEWCSMRKTA